jgi:flagellar basal body-associated protein FliL
MEKEQSQQPQTELDVERQKLELDRQRLQLDIDSHKAATKLESEKTALDRAKERTTKLQIILPLIISAIAILLGPMVSTFSNRQQQLYQTRLELFKKLTEHTSDPKEIKELYEMVFPYETLSTQLGNLQKPTPAPTGVPTDSPISRK